MVRIILVPIKPEKGQTIKDVMCIIHQAGLTLHDEPMEFTAAKTTRLSTRWLNRQCKAT